MKNIVKANWEISNFLSISRNTWVAKHAIHNVEFTNVFYFVSNILVSRKKYFIVGERENDDNA